MKYELEFTISLQLGIDKNEFFNTLRALLLSPEDIDQTSGYFVYKKNILRLHKNNDSNLMLLENSPMEDKFLYFSHILEVFPINDKICLEHQIQLANELEFCLNKFTEYAVAICADFEELLSLAKT